MNVYDMFKYFDHFKYKLNSTYLYVTMIGLLLDYKKNPESIIWDFSTIFNSCLDIIGSFCREFKYLQYLLSNYIKI